MTSYTNIEVKLREKNQITLPADVVKTLDLRPGDSLSLRIGDNRVIEMKPLLRTYEGIFKDLFKDQEDIDNYLREERASCGE